ncbi:alpha/beta hydrolase [Methylophaga muralis]|uniref:Alpha/beta hydrolase family protein n=1 Tax=Methylophaga muralis TaxID=291169 RepID=A0A1E3GQ65_9GAMM|nr:alpha/beta hydrolase [Methylophaga muralis]ODN66170.1 Alpha/beta hydrolase family protein [Methylophaga muralis]
MHKSKTMILFGIIVLLLNACSTVPSGSDRTNSALHKAEMYGWKALEIDAGDFRLLSLLPEVQPSGESLTVFIEGDGLAWLSRSKPSFDPTPINPVSLNLALQARTNTAIAYLARPCQYLIEKNANCRQKYWTSHRFAPEVIEAESIALDKLKIATGTSTLRLVGYSGGGAVASLLAAYRDDVSELITIAGNLDHHTWTTQLGLSPLSGSLNPLDVQQQIAQIPQLHLIGEKDQIMPARIVKRFIDNASPNTLIKIVPGADHHCCWETELNAFLLFDKRIN